MFFSRSLGPYRTKARMFRGLSGTGDSQPNSRESNRANRFAIETPMFIARQANSPESLEFPIRANHPIRANRANRFARITPLSSGNYLSIFPKKIRSLITNLSCQLHEKRDYILLPGASFVWISSVFFARRGVLAKGIHLDLPNVLRNTIAWFTASREYAPHQEDVSMKGPPRQPASLEGPRLAIPPAIYKAPKPGFPKTAAETAGETRDAGGTAAETAGKSAVALRSTETVLFPAVSAAVPPAPRVSPAVSAAVSAAVLGNPGLGAL